jgi:hypothetical protein
MHGQFKMYIMFKPAGADSIWVPLKRVDWSWQGCATKDSEDNWTLDDSSDVSDVGSLVDETNHPLWSRSTDDVDWTILP